MFLFVCVISLGFFLGGDTVVVANSTSRPLVITSMNVNGSAVEVDSVSYPISLKPSPGEFSKNVIFGSVRLFREEALLQITLGDESGVDSRQCSYKREYRRRCLVNVYVTERGLSCGSCDSNF